MGFGGIDELLAEAEVERSKPTTAQSDAHTVAGLLPSLANRTVAFVQGDFERSRDLAVEFARLSRTSALGVSLEDAAIAEVLLGQPETALATVAQLGEFDFPAMDGSVVRALAHLSVGDRTAAIPVVQHVAARAATGTWPAESNEAMLLLAALAHHDGDDDKARHLLRDGGDGRTPGSRGFARHLARQLDIFDTYTAEVSSLYQPDNPHGPMGGTRSLHALRTELTRRGWA